MPRTFRLKSEESLYHIICKSITEIDLFRDSEDKSMYLLLIKKYKLTYHFKLYGYCLMDNHLHLVIDVNGADISKVMHGINFSYAMYFNKKYKRKGHLFSDRFKSKIIDNERYLKTVSLYVHNNPRDISEYKDCPEKYAFSSLGVFLGKSHDSLKIVDYGFIMMLFGNSLKIARKVYYKLLYHCNENDIKVEIEFEDEKSEYKSDKSLLVRNFKAEDIIEFISSIMDISKVHIHIKYNRKFVDAKALVVVLMRSLCNFKCSAICGLLGNITQSRVSKLSTIGARLISSDIRYENIFQDFIKCYS